MSAEGPFTPLSQLYPGTELTPDMCVALAAALERLAQLETEFEEAVEQAKRAAIKEFAYGASHELNNPLANISTRAQSLLAEEPHPERRRKLATIVTQALRAHEMISDLMLFAKPPILRREMISLAAMVDQVLQEMSPQALAQETNLSAHVAPEEALFPVDPVQIAVALKALVRNSLEAVGQKGWVKLEARRIEQQMEISVEDNGPGLTPETQAHLFDPFYSGREAGRGLGFGLCKCWRIAELHGGRVAVESSPGTGTKLTLILPVSSV